MGSRLGGLHGPSEFISELDKEEETSAAVSLRVRY